MSFYVFLPSNDNSYEGNSPNQFRVRLSEPLNLSSESYEVALVELLCGGASSLPNAHRERKFEVPYFFNIESSMRLADKNIWSRVWAEADLEAYVLWRPNNSLEKFSWFLRNCGDKTVGIELPQQFMEAYNFGSWKKIMGYNFSSEPSNDRLEPPDGSYISMVKEFESVMTLASENIYKFYCVLSPGEAIRLVTKDNYLHKRRDGDLYARIHQFWRTNRIWYFVKTYLDMTVMPSDLPTKTVYMYCYTDIVDYQSVGSTSVPLLRVVELQQKKDGELIRDSSALQTPYYLKTNRVQIQDISIRLSDQRGRPINFHSGAHVVVVLHFRHRTD